MNDPGPPVRLPSHAAMAWPTIVAIKGAGGSATNAVIMETVARDLRLSDQQRALRRTPRGSRTLLDYRLAWSRTLLKNMGAIVNDGPCQWSITDTGRNITPEDIDHFVKRMLDRFLKKAEFTQRSD